MTKRKASVDPWVEGINKSGARAAAAYRKANPRPSQVPPSPGLDALVERVIEACAQAAEKWARRNGYIASGSLNARRCVAAAGRRAAKGQP